LLFYSEIHARSLSVTHQLILVIRPIVLVFSYLKKIFEEPQKLKT